jgi:hypothetical protein
MAELSGHERAILDFERRGFSGAGAKEQAIRDTFDVSATQYYQQLNALLDTRAALEYAPGVVRRLRRLRAAGRRSHRPYSPDQPR